MKLFLLIFGIFGFTNSAFSAETSLKINLSDANFAYQVLSDFEAISFTSDEIMFHGTGYSKKLNVIKSMVFIQENVVHIKPAKEQIITEGGIFSDIKLNQNSSDITTSFYLDQAEKIIVTVLTSEGKSITKPISKQFGQGLHQIKIQLSKNQDTPLIPGMYILSFQSNSGNQSFKFFIKK